jgi:hypothetical protein
MRTTTARTMRCRDRRTYSPVAPAPDLCSARARGIGRGAACAHFRRACRVAYRAAVEARIEREAVPAHMVVLRHPGGRPAVKIFPYLSIH